MSYKFINNCSSKFYFFRAERKATVSGQGKRINKLISAYNEDNQNAPELTAAVQEQCQLADGFLLVVNASSLDEEG